MASGLTGPGLNVPAKRAKGGISFAVKWIWKSAFEQSSTTPQSSVKNNGPCPKVQLVPNLRGPLFPLKGVKTKTRGRTDRQRYTHTKKETTDKERMKNLLLSSLVLENEIQNSKIIKQ